MANKFLSTEIIAKQALATLSETLVMKKLIYTDLSSEFSNRKYADTVNIRKPATFVAKDFNRDSGIELQAVNEESIPLKLDQLKDVSFSVTTEELMLHISDFDQQLLTPAMQAIATGVDSAILALRDQITNVVGLPDNTGFEWNKPEALILAGAKLDEKLVPIEGRKAVIGPNTKAQWLNTELMKNVNRSGSTEGLHNASIGQDLFGFNTYMSNNIKTLTAPTSGQPTTEVGIAFHPTAFAFASAPMEPTPGADSYVATYEGVSLRVTMAPDIHKKNMICSIDTLFGVKCVDPDRAVLIKGADKA